MTNTTTQNIRFTEALLDLGIEAAEVTFTFDPDDGEDRARVIGTDGRTAVLVWNSEVQDWITGAVALT
jgi:hypothetical protein